MYLSAFELDIFIACLYSKSWLVIAWTGTTDATACKRSFAWLGLSDEPNFNLDWLFLGRDIQFLSLFKHVNLNISKKYNFFITIHSIKKPMNYLLLWVNIFTYNLPLTFFKMTIKLIFKNEFNQLKSLYHIKILLFKNQ